MILQTSVKQVTRKISVEKRKSNLLDKVKTAAKTKPHKKQMMIDENDRTNDSNEIAYNHNQQSRQLDDDNDDSLSNSGVGDDIAGGKCDLTVRRHCHC